MASLQLFLVFTVFASIVKILADSFFKMHFGGRKTGNFNSEVFCVKLVKHFVPFYANLLDVGRGAHCV